MQHRRFVDRIAFAVFGLVACGGPEDPPAMLDAAAMEMTDAAVAPAAPIATIAAAGIRQLSVMWDVVPGATSYRLLVSRDGVAAPVQLGGDLTATETTIEVPIADHVATTYAVAACNVAGCSTSAPVQARPATLAAIGYFKASNPGSNDKFGVTVALSADGTTLAVGASGEASGTTGVDSVPNEAQANAGAVYVFARVGGLWLQQAYLKAAQSLANSGLNGDQFGEAIALSGDGNTLAIGALYEDSSTVGPGAIPNENQTNAGAVTVFVRAAATWSQQAFIKASNTGPNDHFGIAVALSADGSTLAVGAQGEASNSSSQANNSAAYAGAVYTFTRSGMAWVQDGYLKAEAPAAYDTFGVSVALSGDGTKLAAGAPGDDGPADASPQAGAVYLFDRSGGSWTAMQTVRASNAGAGDNFGTSTALDTTGSTLVVGAYTEASATTGINGDGNDDTASNAGAAYVFARTANTWAQTAYLKASNTDTGDAFGWRVAIDGAGDRVLVLAYNEYGAGRGIEGDPMDNTAASSGAAYYFVRTAGAWTQRSYLKTANSEYADLMFGAAISSDGKTIALGSIYEDSSATGVSGEQEPATSVDDSGAVYLY
ncbi:MAG: integrin [Kofleriaceae bacterium]